eukprot:CAMPEP_0115178266 /NCGR_PEP_ID=MMETSP0270-20121206/5812_1 /TAXON_ID=71861 /ORGANISM="Scrippsiella trochoidea, Strain CCMP3099" /LENGTH=81 /DNA_ID=CAMNT_0002591223 /DNA_START=3 /DNA_END=245 /DNA_ORIENTATION=+
MAVDEVAERPALDIAFGSLGKRAPHRCELRFDGCQVLFAHMSAAAQCLSHGGAEVVLQHAGVQRAADRALPLLDEEALRSY